MKFQFSRLTLTSSGNQHDSDLLRKQVVLLFSLAYVEFLFFGVYHYCNEKNLDELLA